MTRRQHTKFYGSTFFIVAYKLVITANNGDTIHPTGNYYFDTSGTNRSFHFNYAGMKIIQNQALCNNFSVQVSRLIVPLDQAACKTGCCRPSFPRYSKGVNLGANAPQDNLLFYRK